MGSSGQLYSLSWGEFGSSLTSAVQLLRGHGDLVDVTLAAGGRSFPAHKIVLCAASPFLLDLLKSTPCKHPVVMLAGIGADDLESLLEFVYRGEVSVEPSQLPSLLQAAHCLSIHGLTPPTILTENGEEIPPSAVPTMNESLTRDVLNSYLPLKRKKKRRKSSASGSKWPRSDSQGDNESRTTTETHSDDHRGTTDYVQKEDDAASQTDDDGLSKGKNLSDQPASCPLCGAIIRQSRNLRRHLELLHFGLGNGKQSAVRLKQRRTDRSNDSHRISLTNSLRSSSRIEHSHVRTSDNNPPSDLTTSASSLPLGSTASSLSGNLIPPPSSLLGEQGGHPGISSSSCNIPMSSANNSSMYPADMGSASMLGCLLPSLPSLPSLSSSHDVFRHGEMLRAGISYHDSSRQHIRHMQRTDVT